MRKSKHLKLIEQLLAEKDAKDFTYKVRAKHFVLGDSPTRWFFSKMKESTGNGTRCLKDKTGVMRDQGPEMAQVVSDYWTPLYESRERSRSALLGLLDHWDNKLPSHEARHLTDPIKETEMCKVIRKMGYGKAPGLDGLPAELYRHFVAESRIPVTSIPVIKSLTEEFNRVLVGGAVCSDWLLGVMSILYKKGDPTDCSNYRPLVMLNVVYKIFSGILAARLTKALGNITGHHQGAFLLGRLIDDNIRLVQLVIDFLSHSNCW
ncbi:LINE-1 retrotransposable element ORF2 protein [Golovinomyces cichoracearum]|uniref:LINE-1 retrotransposable element ORF2 protein n=1 Tax=Golovinomyces cichoracearum TaxID=62708 RepID=A0A420JBF8_9PEZI|nr:LINE-1 retrotransposable element ORF2 protein [Golovinomyces cichoracearum]